jgi:hypothetical protein
MERLLIIAIRCASSGAMVSLDEVVEGFGESGTARDHKENAPIVDVAGVVVLRENALPARHALWSCRVPIP